MVLYCYIQRFHCEAEGIRLTAERPEAAMLEIAGLLDKNYHASDSVRLLTETPQQFDVAVWRQDQQREKDHARQIEREENERAELARLQAKYGK